MKELSAELSEEERRELIPNVEVFKEIMVELIRNREIDLEALKKEQSQYLQDEPEEFQINEMLLKLTDNTLKKLRIERLGDREPVVFAGIPDGEGRIKSIRCSNVRIQAVRGD